MGGDLARAGFRFQDLYLLLRLLREAGETLDQGAPDRLFRRPDEVRFGIEAKLMPLGPTAAAGPAWDVTVEAGQTVEVVEVKSGEITREDRTAYWRRLRRELFVAREDMQIRPMLVADPGRTGDLNRWRELATAAITYSGSLPESAPQRVNCTNDLLAEALWWLCVANDKDKLPLGPAPAVSTSIEALSRITVEAHPADELDARVLRSLELLFSDGLSDQVRDSILGWFGARAVSKEPERRFFTAIDLLGEMGARAACASLTPGILDEWRNLWTDLPKIFDDRVRMRLGQTGESVAAALAQPSATSELTGPTAGGCLLFGKGGAGKTSLLAQIAQQARDAGAEVFCTLADAADEANLDTIIRSLRFRRALLALRTPECKFWLGVDGLDEVNASLRVRWAKHLKRLALDERTVVFTTVREATWTSDSDLRRHLAARHSLLVDDWPEDLVRSLLASTPHSGAVSPTLFTLLRQPLFLDLFWRTFIEHPSALGRNAARAVETRHGVLTAFWKERVSESSRHHVPNLAHRLDEILRSAAVNVGSFALPALDQEAMTVLEGESVLILEGSLNPRYRFRHPLLRDFAFALWCLRAGNAEGVIGRWQLIKGGLQRQGALRAMFEALLDPIAASQFPEISVNELVAALSGNPSSASHLARLLGTLEPVPSLDPAWWTIGTRELLPAAFGRELIVSARLIENAAWANNIVHWPADASWLDGEYPKEILNYADVLHRRANRTAADASGARQAARTLRALSEHPRYASEFLEVDRWLKSAALTLVVQVLSDLDTLGWVEREMTVGSWRTRGFLLEHLVHLANVDATRTAAVYRQAVGLSEMPLRTTLDAEKWNSIMDHQAIEWSLAGADQHRSLLAEHPKEFLPIILDLVEVLSQGSGEVARSEDDATSFRSDLPEWGNFWGDHSRSARDRCLQAIKTAGELALANGPLVFLKEIYPILRSSRSTAVQSICLDLILQQAGDASFARAIRDCLLDGRLYASRALMHWVETALRRQWSELSSVERSVVLQNIDAVADPSTNGSEYRRAQLFATLPLVDLPSPHMRVLAASRLANGYHPTAHPHIELDYVVRDSPVDENDRLDVEQAKGWPAEFDFGALCELARAGRALSDNRASAEVVRQYLPRAVAAAETLFPALEQYQQLLDSTDRFWVWYALEAALEKGRFDHVAGLSPSSGLLKACSQIAFTFIEGEPSGLHGMVPTEGMFVEPENFWLRALHLADTVLVWPLMQEDEDLQRRFERVLRAAFATRDTGIQIAVTTTVRPYHWLRDDARRRLQDELIWNAPSGSDVLLWSLQRLAYESDARRTEILRFLLNRTDMVDRAERLAESLGQWLGSLAMQLLPDGSRMTTVTLLEEVLDSPGHWSLLKKDSVQEKFLRSTAFGMKDAAKRQWAHAELAAEFAKWNLSIWQHMRLLQVKKRETDAIILFALHWLEQEHRERAPEDEEDIPKDPVVLRRWWEHLMPFWRAVVDRGSRKDAFHLLFGLRSGQLNHLIRCEEVFELIDILLNRLDANVATGDTDLDQTEPENNEYHSWRYTLSYAAAAMDALRRDNLLRTDQQRERAYSLLRRLAEAPFRIEQALSALHHLQADQT